MNLKSMSIKYVNCFKIQSYIAIFEPYYSQPFTLYLVFHQPYAIFLLLMFSQQGIQIMFLEDYECFILYGGNILASVYGDRVWSNRKWMGRSNL